MNFSQKDPLLNFYAQFVVYFVLLCGRRYIVRVVASEPSTEVVWQSPTGRTDGRQTVMPGGFVEILTDQASAPLLVTCSKPCLVVMYNTGMLATSPHN